VLDGVRRLVVAAFGDGFEDADWEHALGGLHALVHLDGELVAHGAVVQRHLLHGGRALRVGYVEAVAVADGARRRGHASTVMAALEDVVRRAYDAGALSATDAGAGLYSGRGWLPWRGSTWALAPDGRVRTPRTTTRCSSSRASARSTSTASSPATGATATSGDAPAAAGRGAAGAGRRRHAGRFTTGSCSLVVPFQARWCSLTVEGARS
jgi:aminoglycoside 2'-N-acetyltransferase I